jgi:hypothetical protein
MTQLSRLSNVACAVGLLISTGCLVEEDSIGEDEDEVQCPDCVDSIYGGGSEAGGGGTGGGGGGGNTCFGACGKGCEQCQRQSDGSYKCRTSDYCQQHDACLNAGNSQSWCAYYCVRNDPLCSTDGLRGYGHGPCRPSPSDPFACNRPTNNDGQYCRTVDQWTGVACVPGVDGCCPAGTAPAPCDSTCYACGSTNGCGDWCGDCPPPSCDSTCYSCGTYNECGDYCGACNSGYCGDGVCDYNAGDDYACPWDCWE